MSEEQTPLVQMRIGKAIGSCDAVDRLADNGMFPSALLRRHEACDWGDLTSEEVSAANDRAAIHGGGRIVSGYTLPDGSVIRIITEADRSETLVLTQEEF